jgi:hypothetical protein
VTAVEIVAAEDPFPGYHNILLSINGK